MKKKLGFFLVILMIFALTIGFGVQQERKSSSGDIEALLKGYSVRPSGVSPDLWIPLSDNAGIVLKKPLETAAGHETVCTGTIVARAEPGSSWNELIIENSFFIHKIGN